MLADTLPVDLVEDTEKGREKDRRQVTREEKILQQKEEHVSTLTPFQLNAYVLKVHQSPNSPRFHKHNTWALLLSHTSLCYRFLLSRWIIGALCQRI